MARPFRPAGGHCAGSQVLAELARLWDQAVHRAPVSGETIPLTQERLAQVSGVPKTTVNSWATGNSLPRDLDQLTAVARVLAQWAGEPRRPDRGWAELLAADRAARPDITAPSRQEHHQAPPESSRVRVGASGIPAPASAFQTRADLREQVEAARTRSTGVVLAGGGGVGKSQLAAFYAREAIGQGADLVMWVDAAARGAIIAAYALAAGQIPVPGVTGKSEDVEADARMFLDWAAVTERSWLVVLDNVTDLDQIASWWPVSHTGTGWVMSTTRRRDAALSGSGRLLVDVDVYHAAESAAYLSQRLLGAGKKYLLDEQAGSLAETLGHLPLALSHAAAYMVDQQIRCATYLARYNAGLERLDQLMPGDPDGHGKDPDGHSRRITVTLLLALDAADNCAPVGLARPAMALAAILDPSGHPEAFWANDAVTKYLTSHRTPGDSPAPPAAEAAVRSSSRLADPDRAPADKAASVTAEEARAAVMLLNRFSLAAFDEHAGPRAFRVHALTARAACETAPAGQVPRTARVAADAVMALWPDADHSQPDLAITLRANADVLYSHDAEALWQPHGHPLLNRAGLSLSDAGLHPAAVTYWRRLTADAERIQGRDHWDTLNAQAELGHSYFWTGHIAEAIALSETAVAGMRRILGPDHPQTLYVQALLALFYERAGRTTDAEALGRRAASGIERIQNPGPAGMVLRSLTADASAADAIASGQKAVARIERDLGRDHPDTLNMQMILAAHYGMAGRAAEAVTAGEKAAAGMERTLGPDHPATLNAQALAAASYGMAGRAAEAVTAGEKAAAGMERTLGPDHPDTLNAQGILATLYDKAGRFAEAIALGERAVAGMKRVLGSDHPTTLEAKWALAAAYASAGRPADAIKLGTPTLFRLWKRRQLRTDSKRKGHL